MKDLFNDRGIFLKILVTVVGFLVVSFILLRMEFMVKTKTKGFASTNIVLGVGSYSMGYCTRDNQGSAVKATYVEINGEGREIFKDPITDDGTKKSATGLLKVDKDENGNIVLYDKVSWEEENSGLLKTIYKDGEFTNTTTLTEIRKRLTKN